MAELVKVKLHITPAHFAKISKGKHAQFSNEHLMSDSHFLHLHPMKAKKIEHAKRHKKGARVHLDSHEFKSTMEGGGFMDFINKLKDAGNWVKSNIIDSGFYQQNIKPIARSLVNAGVAAVAPRLGAAAPAASAAVDAIGNATNAYGIGRKHKSENHLQNFVAQSMVAPRPGGNSGFTAMPQASTGDGLDRSASIHHHYYYNFDHDHMKKGKGKHTVGGSFMLA